MTKINDAVRLCVDRIAVAQQNITALHTISSRMSRSGKDDEEVRRAISILHGQLSQELAEAWNNLSWFAPISHDAMSLLAERTKTWFQRDDTQIMHWLGYEGSYYSSDRDAFRREVLAMFGCEQEAEK